MSKLIEAGKGRYLALRNWYEKYERHIGTASLFTGFIFDSLTLQRIDAWRENLWIALNLLVSATCVVLLNRKEAADPERHFWIYTILQFSFGSMLGAFFIFYFQSSTIAVSWPFLLILIFAMLANELFQRKYARLVLQVSFLYLSIYTFLIFLVPIVLHRIGGVAFLLSGILSLTIVWLYFRLLGRAIWKPVLVIFVAMNVLYFANIIPAIPLSLKDAGIYHGISRMGDGSYMVVDEEDGNGMFQFLRMNDSVHWLSGDTLYAYNAIYSPAKLNTSVIHEWQYFDEGEGRWVTASRIPLSLTGGRLQGFRTYSSKSNLSYGNWRVNVTTESGQFIGRIKFELVPLSGTHNYVTLIKE